MMINNELNKKTTSYITNDIEKKFCENECENTGKIWKKNCPKCNCEQVYATKRCLVVAAQKNKVCIKCKRKQEKWVICPSDGWSRICPNCQRKLIYTCKGSLDLAIKQNRWCNNCCKTGKKKHKTIKSKFKRNCPSYNKEMFYSTFKSLKRAILRNLPCLSCLRKGENNVMYGKKHTPEVVEILRKINLGRHPSKKTRKKMSMSNAWRGIHRYGSDSPFYGKRHTDDWKRHMRVLMCKRLLKLRGDNKNAWINNIGKKENRYFSKLEKDKGWNGIYHKKSGKQFLIKDLGYFVDYYEPKLNIVVEYDEPRHYRFGVLKDKDIKRMNEIKNHLGCQFWRYNEYEKKLVEF